MANRYWVGGTASWDGTAGTKWSTTSGGAGGASVPTTADDVFFDANSTGTCTISTVDVSAKSINCTGFAGTITGNKNITVVGSVTLSSAMTYTHTGTVTFTGSGTLITAGKAFGAVTVNGAGITLTLGGSLNISTRTITVTQGEFNTANYSVTAGSLQSSATNTRTITLGSSTVTLSGSTALDFATSTNLTVDAGTSQINMSGTNVTFRGGGQTFYNVSFTSTGGGGRSITEANTFNNLTNIADAAGITQLLFNADQTVNGTFTCAGSNAIQRGFVASDTIGTTRTITAAAISANDCDFRDITLAGAAAGASPTRAGDCGGNSGITFPAAKTVYRVGTNTTWAGASSWATTSGGTGSDTNFPLPQDTAVIDNNTALTGTLAFTVRYSVSAIDCSSRTTAITLNHNVLQTIYGSYTLGSGVTVSGTQTQFFAKRGTMVFTSAGKTITFPINIQAPGGTLQLGDAYSASNSVTLTLGIFDANNYNFSATRFASNIANTRTINMGSGLWTLSATAVGLTSAPWNTSDTTNLTFNKGTADILLSGNTTSARAFFGGGLSFNKLTIGGNTTTSITTLNGASSFTELASTKTVAHTVRLATNLGIIETWSITGTAGNVVTVDSDVAGTQRTFTLSNVTSGIDYLSVKDIRELSSNKFYVGPNSTDGGNNSNVYFTIAPSVVSVGNFLQFFNGP